MIRFKYLSLVVMALSVSSASYAQEESQTEAPVEVEMDIEVAEAPEVDLAETVEPEDEDGQILVQGNVDEHFISEAVFNISYDQACSMLVQGEDIEDLSDDEYAVGAVVHDMLSEVSDSPLQECRSSYSEY